jgi:uncharacterized protein involved in outer membrane biogenesis
LRVPRSHALRNALIAAGLLAAAICTFLWLFDWNWLKRPIERAVTGATGRELRILGDVSGTWEWDLRPQLRLTTVRLANPGWATDPSLLQADAIQFKLRLLPLLARKLHLDMLFLEAPHLSLERGKDGRATWYLDRNQDNPASTPEIGWLSIRKGTARIRNAAEGTDIEAKVDENPAKEASRALAFEAKGRLRALSMQVKGSTASLLVLRNLEQPLPIEAQGFVADTKFALEGSVAGLQRFERAELRYRIEGSTLKALGLVFDAPLPNTPPYRIAGMLRHGPGLWASDDLRGTFGRSDVAGKVELRTAQAKPHLEVRLDSRLLDLADLGPLVGYVRASAPPAQAGKDLRGVQASRLLPVASMEMKNLERLNAHAVIHAQQVVRPHGFPFDNFRADYRLLDSRILIDPLEFGFADGSLRLRVELDARKTLRAQVRGGLKGVRLSKILRDKRFGEAAGVVSGSLDLRGTGSSVAAMAAGASGRIGAVLTEGRVPALLPALADLDGARILTNLFKEKSEGIVCTAIDLSLENGIATPTVAIVETESTVITGTGTASLKDETVGLRLQMAPKHPSILSLRTPLRVSGPMRHPRISLEPGPLGARAAAGIGLGLLNPLLALFATIETGPGRDGACPEISAAMKQQRLPEPVKSPSTRPPAPLLAKPARPAPAPSS